MFDKLKRIFRYLAGTRVKRRLAFGLFPLRLPETGRKPPPAKPGRNSSVIATKKCKRRRKPSWERNGTFCELSNPLYYDYDYDSDDT